MLEPSFSRVHAPGLVHADAPETTETIAPSSVRLRVTDNPRRLDAWALALTSKGLSPLIHWVEGAFELHVAPRDALVASAELDAMDIEEHEVRRAVLADAALEQRPASRHAAAGAVLVSALLLAFFVVTGPRIDGASWFSAGASDAERVLHGEWWRAITALTLHSDSAHVISNVGFGTLVVGAVMRAEGIGWGAALIVASGTAGNLANAWLHQTLHRSVGFSTAVFGAIGILSGLAYMQGRRRVRPMRPAWTALAGTVAMLALLGVSEKGNVDVYAHLFGAVAGVLVGLAAGWLRWRPTTSAGQWFAGLSVAATVAGAWLVALG